MATKQAQQRTDKKFKYKRDRVPNLRDKPRFRYFVKFANGRTAELENVLSCSWDDATAILTGNITAPVPEFGGNGAVQRIEKGDRIACYVSMHGEKYRYVWTMRVFKPQYHAAERQRSFELANDLELLRRSEDNFWFKDKDSKHPHGWTGPQIIRETCKRFDIPIGAIYGSSKPLTKGGGIHVKRGSPLEVLRQVAYRENHRWGRRVVIRWYRGRLYVLPLQRSRDLLALGPTLVDAVLSSELSEEFASAITIHSINAKELGKGAKGLENSQLSKMHLYLESSVSRRLYGYVHKIVWSADAKTMAKLRQEGVAYLRAAAKAKRSLSMTHAGLPFLRRGDAIRVALGGKAMRRQILWASHITHTAQPDGYTSEIEVTFEDPYISRRGQSILKKLKATRDDAVQSRARLDPLWYAKINNKGDVAPGADAFAEALRGRRRAVRGEDSGDVGLPTGGPN